VLDLVVEKLPVTGELVALAILIALSIGVPMGSYRL
jgi:ABC-type dipeptide/oligopeptide/nickel transport system permease component